MAKFDIDKAMEIAKSGDEERIRRLFEGIQERLSRKRYGLVWERGGEDEDSGFEAENVVLDYKAGIPYPKLRADLSTYPERADGNMLLEGDNYIWLKILEQTHANSIDAIYTDPPYNTGNKDFKYNDAFVDPDDIFRHSKWLDFMDKRLRVAKNLLKDTGVIFISIGSQEMAQLVLLCNEIFGEDNLISLISIELSTTQGMKVKSAQSGGIVKNSEWILAYAKDSHKAMKNATRTPLYDYRPDYDTHYNKYLDENDCILNVKDVYNEAHPEAPISSFDDYQTNETFQNFVSENANRIFSYDKTTGFIVADFEPGKIYRVQRGDRSYTLQVRNDKVSQLMFLDASFGICDDFAKSIGFRKIRGDWWKDFYKDMGNVSKEGGYAFNNGKKPARLIEQLCKWAVGSNPDALILDFFAGSGTTAQGVEQLNAQDGGHRHWILITNNEDQDGDDDDPETGICRDITKPRIDTVITGTKPDGSTYGKGYDDSGYQYFQYDFIKRDRHLYERNADRFFKPYIVDALIPIKHGVARTVQDGTRKLCAYESSTKKVVALFANTKPEDVQGIVDEYFADDDREHLLLLPEGTSAYKAIVKAQVKNGVDVQYHHSLISTADYLE